MARLVASTTAVSAVAALLTGAPTELCGALVVGGVGAASLTAMALSEITIPAKWTDFKEFKTTL